MAHQTKIPGKSGIWSGGFLQNPRAQKVNLNIFYLIWQFVAKWHIRQKYKENLGFDREVSCKIFGFKKLTWISSIWSDNLLQNGASNKNTRKILDLTGNDREVSCKILGLKKLTWISSIWSDNLLQNGASDKNTRKIWDLIKRFLAKS